LGAQTIVPLTIVGSHRPVRPLPSRSAELHVQSDGLVACGSLRETCAPS